MTDERNRTPASASLRRHHLARYRAKKAVKEQLHARGVKLSYVSNREIVAMANDHLRQHWSELIADAEEMAREMGWLLAKQYRGVRSEWSYSYQIPNTLPKTIAQNWGKSAMSDTAPTTVNRTLPQRQPNSAYRQREYLTETEVNRLIEAARKRGRNGQG